MSGTLEPSPFYNDILSGHGAYQAGGRWNAPGIYAIYGSLEPGLAADESFNFLLRHFGWQSRDVPPRMLVGIRVSLRAVLDLTNLKSGPYSSGFGTLAFGGLAQNKWRAKGKPLSGVRARCD
jgi:hypothetical protein